MLLRIYSRSALHAVFTGDGSFLSAETTFENNSTTNSYSIGNSVVNKVQTSIKNPKPAPKPKLKSTDEQEEKKKPSFDNPLPSHLSDSKPAEPTNVTSFGQGVHKKADGQQPERPSTMKVTDSMNRDMPALKGGGGGGGGCISLNSLITLESGKRVCARYLRIGDSVLTKRGYEPVVCFLHRLVLLHLLIFLMA